MTLRELERKLQAIHVEKDQDSAREKQHFNLVNEGAPVFHFNLDDVGGSRPRE